MTILRSGGSDKYAENWGSAFGGKKKNTKTTAKKKSTKKTTAKKKTKKSKK